MSDRLYLGIDPGVSGGLALIDAAGVIVTADPMPELEPVLADYLREFAARIAFAHIEEVHAFPGQGVTSMFTFGRSYGALRMALMCFRIPFRTIQPRAWQAIMGIPQVRRKGVERNRANREKKKRNREAATQMYPQFKFTEAMVDAVLIAQSARRVHLCMGITCDGAQEKLYA